MEIGGRLSWMCDALVALSLANLCFLTVWRELLFADAADSYWIPDYTRATFFAIMINVLALSLLIYVMIRFLFRSRSRYVAAVSRLLVLSLLVFPLNYFRIVTGIDEHTIHWFKDHRWITIPGSVLVGTTILLSIALRLKQLTRAVGLVCLIFSPFSLTNLAQAAWIAGEHASTGLDASGRAMASKGESVQRVLWLLMDELDLRLAFLERPSGLELPEFDRLRRQSLFAHEAASHSRNTEEAIPSFLLQRVVKSARPIGPANLQLTFMEFEKIPDADFASMPNVFAEASAHGARIAILGFYHPYCRLFGDEAEYCRNYSMNTYAPFATDALAVELWSQILGITPFYRRTNAIRTYLDAAEHLRRIIADPDFDLIYVHASVPHGPNIWNRASQRLTILNTSSHGYFDNLILADRFLGSIRRTMERTGLWDSTVVLVTSDHEWRHAYLYDHRRVQKIPFVLKMRGQQQSVQFRTAFSPMRVTKDLLREIQGRSLVTPRQVMHWLEARARALEEL